MLAAVEKPYSILNGKRLTRNNMRVSPLPQFYNPSNSADRAVLARVDSFGVTRGSEKPLVAWKFLQFAIGQDNLRSYFEKTSVPSPRLDLILEQESTPNVGVFVRQAKFAKSFTYPLSSSFIKKEFTDMITLVNERKASVQEGLSLLETKFNAALRQKQQKVKEIETLREKKEKEAK